MTIAIKKTLADIETAAKTKAKPDAIVHKRMAIGEYHRQGDVYFHRVGELEFERDTVHRTTPVMSTAGYQIAPGETQGSRHVVPLRDLTSIQIGTHGDATALHGPMIKAKKAFTVEHPEHGAVTLPKGTYQVYYQRQFAEELRRVAD